MDCSRRAPRHGLRRPSGAAQPRRRLGEPPRALLEGRNRRDARLFLVSLACLSSAGFLGLHALATPGVLLGKNAGFELATPVGLVVASAFAAASARELSDRAIRAGSWLAGGLVAV